MADALEEAISRYLNQWKHCDRLLHAQDSKIRCECGQSWVWVETLGETMELLAIMEEVTTRTLPSPSSSSQEVSLF